ncbi:response regulator [Mucilaginibacter mali]|uniref:histidine kinase n=1 Tax=Mucilaginibacter mali TaxID=2740462 RepID=A0A7D4Q468_9SPHI|nr:hybrid sensor histidine kinase/response regulator transcription factor [Mucilaginibacter mali]QKJ30727.1 response regulator [Mucilaginibacter mali]
MPDKLMSPRKRVSLMPKWLFGRVCLLLLLAAQASFGQQELNFTALTTKNGMSANTVNVILQDHKGLIWLGTSDGLNKFDGTNFTAYIHNEQDSTSLPANEVVSLLEDNTGKLWVGTSGGGLAYYDQQHDVFVSYKGDKSIRKTQPVTARAFYQDHEKNLWIGSYGGFRIIDPSLKKVDYVDITRLVTNTVNTPVILSFFEDRLHRMWIGTNAGLLLYDRGSNSFTRFAHADNDATSLSGDEVRGIAQDAGGRLFFGTNKGLNMLRPGEKTFGVFKHADGEPASIVSNLIYTVVAAPNGKLWIGTEEGLSIFDCTTFNSVNIKPDRRKSYSLTNKCVRSIYFAKKGIVWLGTYQGGANKLDPNLALFNLKRGTPFDPHGLSSSVVTAFAEYKKGEIFVGTDGGGLHFFDRYTGLFNHYDIKSKADHSGNSLPIMALELDAQKTLWIGTYQNGLFAFNPASGTYKQYLADGTSHEPSQNDIFFVKQDSKGLIWIGTNGRGVDVLDPRTQTFVNYNNRAVKGKAVMPLNGFMRAIAEDRNGDIWLGSAGSGLAVYHPGNGQFRLYDRVNSQLSNDGVLSILHDHLGNTWVGTNSGGINLFHPDRQKFTHLTEADGLANGVVYKMVEDAAGTIWISTDKGISSIDPKTKKIKNFGRPNGVQDSPFVLGAGMVTSSGELFFGGQDGFNYFTPSTLPVHSDVPTVLLTDLKVANNKVVPGANAPLREQISSAKDIYLDYGQNFAISYVALNYTAPQQNQYAYKLIGFDHDWNKVGREKTAYYTNIDPGDYVFQVQASNNDGLWSTRQGTAINIHVRPPLWRTPYAYFLYVLIIAGGFLYIRHRGIQKIKNKLALEQEKINARKLIEQQRREAEYIHELDMQKIKFLTNLSHEFRTPISLMLAPADKLLATQKDPAVSSQVKMIRRNARRLLNLVNQLLDFRKMEEQELKLNLTQGDLIGFIKEAAESFHDLSDRKKIALSIASTAPYMFAQFDHDKVERVIFNLLSNAFKFTGEGGQVQVKMSVSHHDALHPLTLYITIADTGIGIDPEMRPRIFDRFFMESKASSILNQGSGIGLSITREFVQLHGGEITVESEPGKGTTFNIKLPVIGATMPFADEITDREELRDTVQAGDAPLQTEAGAVMNKLPVVLLVEDNEEFRYHLKDSLQSYYQILEAKDGKEGWQKALSGHPQLIVSDIGMPYMNGIELSQKIKTDKRTNHIPVILLTASSAEEDQLKGLESGANDYLTKPFKFDILNTKIKNLLVYNRSLKDAYSRQIQVTGKEIEIESTDAKLLNTIVQYIDAKLNDPELSVEELSRHVGMSRGSLYHKLLELTELTPIEYIRSVKLERAAVLLEKSDYNVAQIAYMTGFGTPSYFSRLFKSRYNVLPSEYITANRKDNRSRLEGQYY